MKCPNCNETLVMSERQGIEIDYCPNCRGVWLDRGELDKIIERSSGGDQRGANPSDYHESHKKYGNYKPHRRKSFLEELFD
ncbi:MAG: hypothetical protein HC906_06960 [Bacteroidales bacterium]|nr:hypothetical protein [Bacteroidales bacterium]